MHILGLIRFINAYLRRPPHFRSFAVCSCQNRFAPCTFHASTLLRRLLLTVCIAFDPYSYTRGHWLDRDEQRRKARRLEFSFDALIDIAVNHSEGAREVVACEKREGGFNRVFIIEFDNGAKVVAKVPMQYAGPASSTTMSEVATMKYGIGSPPRFANRNRG